MEFVLKNPCRQLCSFSLAPCQRAMHVPSPSVCTPLDKSWAHSFSAQSHWWNLSWKTRANSSALLALLPANKAMHLHTAWQVLGAQFLGTIALMKFALKKPCQQLRIFRAAPCQRSYACPIAQWLHAAWQVLGAQFLGTIALMEFVLKTPCQQLCSFSLAPCQQSYASPIAQCLHTAWQVLGAQFFGTIALIEFVLKNPCPQPCSFSLAPCQQSYAFAHRLTSLGRTVSRHNRIDEICPENPVPTAAPCQRSYACPIAQWLHAAWQVLGAQFLGTIALMEPVLKNPCQQLCSFSLAPCEQSYASPIAQCLHTAWQVLGAQFFGTIALIEFVLKNPCQQPCSFSLAPCQQSYAFAHRLTSLGRTVFRHNRIDGICPENPCQ